jgi:hypothetical protein
MYMHPHLSSMFIQVTCIYPTLFIHIYYLHSSKWHPCINLFSSMYSMISIQNHLHSSKFESTYIHVSICVHPHLSRYSTLLIHSHYIYFVHYLMTFIYHPTTFIYIFIYIHPWLSFGLSSTVFIHIVLPTSTIYLFSSTFHPQYPSFMHVHVLLYNTPILPYISWIVYT